MLDDAEIAIDFFRCDRDISKFILLIFRYLIYFFFFLNDTPTPEIYPFPLPAALPIPPIRCPSSSRRKCAKRSAISRPSTATNGPPPGARSATATWRKRKALPAPQQRRNTSTPSSRSEEHTSELQSPCNLVCRLLLEKK